MCFVFNSTFLLLQGVKEDNWEAFIADALFLGKVITIDEFVGLLQLPSLIHKSILACPILLSVRYGSELFILFEIKLFITS